MTNLANEAERQLLVMRRHRVLAEQYPRLLGLRLVPIGLSLLVAPTLGPFEASAAHYGLATLAALAVAWIHVRYRRRFGVVEAGRPGIGRSVPILAGTILASVAAAHAGDFPTPQSLLLTLALVLLATCVLFVLPLSFRAGARFEVGRFAVVAGGAVAAVVVAKSIPSAVGTGDLLCVVIGLLLCLAGVAEHRALRAALPEPLANHA